MGAAAPVPPAPRDALPVSICLAGGFVSDTETFFSPPAHGCVVGERKRGEQTGTPGFCSWIGGHGAKWNPQKMRFRSGRRTRAVGSTQHAFLVSPSDGSRA